MKPETYRSPFLTDGMCLELEGLFVVALACDLHFERPYDGSITVKDDVLYVISRKKKEPPKPSSLNAILAMASLAPTMRMW